MKLSFRKIGIVVGMLMLLTLANLFQIPKAHALINNGNLSAPSWWVDNTGSFSQCDTYQYNHGRTWQGQYFAGAGVGAVQLSTNAIYRGVPACGASDGKTHTDVHVYFTSDAQASQENEWECTELVKRYLYLAYGVKSVGNNTNGYNLAANYASTYSNLFADVSNGNAQHVLPSQGDALSFAAFGSFTAGHTALVTAVNVNSSGVGTISIIDQNNGNDPLGTGTLHVGTWASNTSNPAWNIDTERNLDKSAALGKLTDWIHPKTDVGGYNPPTSTATILNGVKAIAGNNVYAVGYYMPGGSSYDSLVENWNGNSWTQITSGDAITSSVQLSAVDASNATNVWAVGQTLFAGNSYVLHYDGASWKTDTTVPNIGSLTAVKALSNGDVWIAGGGYVVQQHSGVWGTPITLTNYPGIASIDAVSSTNVWISGTTSSGRAFVAYWTGGTSFTEVNSEPNPETGSGEYDTLTGIRAFASNDVWVTGYVNPSPSYGYVSHWNGSSWSTPTTFNPSNGTRLYAIDGESSSNLWVAGVTNTQISGTSIVEHYANGSWSAVSSPATAVLYSISMVTSHTTLGYGNVWAVGYNTQLSQSPSAAEFFN